MMSDVTSLIIEPMQVPPGHAARSVVVTIAASGVFASATNVHVAPASGDSAIRVRIACWFGTLEYAIAPPGVPAGYTTDGSKTPRVDPTSPSRSSSAVVDVPTPVGFGHVRSVASG